MNMEQKKINIGLIGLGARGTLLLHDVLLEHEDAVICAVCDVYEDRCERRPSIFRKRLDKSHFRQQIIRRSLKGKRWMPSFFAVPGSPISTWLSKRWSVARQWDARSEEPIPFGNVGGL